MNDQNQNLSFFDKLNLWLKNSVTIKLVTVGILILLLLIPTSMLESLIRERETLRDNATSEVSSKWGGQQVVGGIVISIPYKVFSKNEKGEEFYSTSWAHFLPDQLTVNGTLNPEKRNRGIYVVVLYNSILNISGNFSSLNTNALSITRQSLLFDKALVTLGISDMKGIKDDIQFKMNDIIKNFEPGILTNDIFASGVSFPIDLNAFYADSEKNKSEKIDFSFNLNLNGSSEIYFLPLGKQTNVSIKSPWKNPGFEGTFLPDTRNVDENGFTANWKILQLNRNYPQQGLNNFINAGAVVAVENNYNYDYQDGRYQTNDNILNQAGFGLRLLLPIDEYQKTMRSAKYSVMFIILTFLIFFFIEIINKKRIHPIQYLLVGFAVCLFYVLLLSISEHLSFNTAYLIGCTTILSLITFYGYYVLQSKKLTIVMSFILAILYGFFYSLLQLEDYSLLMGSIGLLIILSIIMYFTRNIDWYNRDNN
jgi:inner membrane protein